MARDTTAPDSIVTDPDRIEPQTADQKLLSSAIKASGMSVRRFARDALVREPRSVWRWLTDENALPSAVRLKCQAMIDSDAKLE